MSILTPEIAVKLGIVQGKVYNFTNKPDVHNHYFIVLNSNPQSCEDIHLAMFTTKKDSLKHRITQLKLDNAVYVEVISGECTFLAKPNDTCVDCSKPIKLSVDELIDLIERTNGGVCNFPEIDDSLKQRICHSLQINKLLSVRVKSECNYVSKIIS